MSQLSIENKFLIYKTIIKPIWTYGIEISGCACKSSQPILQKAQSRMLRMITNAPWYVSNLTLHEDLTFFRRNYFFLILAHPVYKCE